MTARYIGAEPEAESWLSAYGQKAASARERLQKLLSGGWLHYDPDYGERHD
ncbi:hypothetical protein N2384_09115 [Bacillus paralicheniformis]|uniref:hypothetical protein n=1 Tax=Bacillus paralicheniformis TaxID=1648923 RepID=UPI0021A802B5|nr:hypothetical protein [Bacillus paralicheniformis]UWS62979.1 hypothetical protein N2384_09115 [Bacillus paralicheniformis]